MKTFIGIFLCLSLASCGPISGPQPSRESNSVTYRQGEYFALDSSFYIWNQTHANIGLVGVRLVDSSIVWINVTDSGMYGAHLSTAPAYCIISGSVLPYSSREWETITLHLSIRADWTTNVVVVDKSEET